MQANGAYHFWKIFVMTKFPDTGQMAKIPRHLFQNSLTFP